MKIVPVKIAKTHGVPPTCSVFGIIYTLMHSSVKVEEFIRGSDMVTGSRLKVSADSLVEHSTSALNVTQGSNTRISAVDFITKT